MRIYLLLTTCLFLVGCGRQVEVKRSEPARWAFANKREIESAISEWSRDKMEELKKAEALSPEVEEKVRHYETLRIQLMHKEMEARGYTSPPRMGASENPAPDKDYQTLSKEVAQAKAPIADILERRGKQASQYREQYSVTKLIAEYVKDRFDLIVDSSEERYSRSGVLFRTNREVLDITDGIIKLFNEKAKP